MSRYDDWVKKGKIPAETSIIELGILGKQLGIDTNAISKKHFDALYSELLEAVKAKGLTLQ